jgi:predicted ArsR family transcriptional regulator
MDASLTEIGVLSDPVRYQLYRFVCSQAQPVSRDQAAQALQIPRHQAKFHLDRLAAEGLLETDYVRISGRTGPGAGRPAKRYRRGTGELSVTIPPREYELAGEVMADAIAESARTGRPIGEAVREAAAGHGRAIAAGAEPASDAGQALTYAEDVLTRHGYEPQRQGESLTLTNCPFHGLAQRETALVCGMNHALLTAAANTLAPELLEARMDPGEGRCCVTLSVRRNR